MSAPERCKVDEAMLVTGLERRTLQNLSARGEVWGAAKLGGQWTYDRQALRAWVRAQENEVASRRTSTSATACGTLAFKLADESIDARYRRARAERLRGASPSI